MAKAKTAYVCNQCGAEYTKWQGQCEACEAWNTLSEFVIAPASAGAAKRSGYAGAVSQAKIVQLTDVAASAEARTTIGIGELDRVLGGGLVAGSVVLVGGDPGIGKSTLLLQVLGALGARLKSLYVSGEESLAQIAARAQRLGLPLEPLRCLAETCIERIVEQSQKDNPRVLVIDSIQTIWTETLTAAPGSVSQVRESAARLVRFAKEGRGPLERFNPDWNRGLANPFRSMILMFPSSPIGRRRCCGNGARLTGRICGRGFSPPRISALLSVRSPKCCSSVYHMYPRLSRDAPAPVKPPHDRNDAMFHRSLPRYMGRSASRSPQLRIPRSRK